jgi:hypothetical protein
MSANQVNKHEPPLLLSLPAPPGDLQAVSVANILCQRRSVISTFGACFMTRLASRTPFACCICAVFLLGVCALTLVPSHQSSTSFSVSFLSLTNDPVQGAIATFCVTNPTDRILFYQAGPPQIKSDQGWSPSWTPRGAGGTNLPAHQGSTFMVRASLSGDPWRVPIIWNHVPAGLERFRGQVRYNVRVNWHLLRQGRSPKLFKHSEVDACMSYSPEVTNQLAEPNGAANRSQPIRPETNRTSVAAGSDR